MTPYVKLRQLKLSPQVIVQSKAFFGEELCSLNKASRTTANDFSKSSEKFQQIAFNAKSLDELTDGGVDVGAVTEIFGEAGCGKTQLCLQLALNCALPNEYNGLNGKTCYVSTDKRFPISRLAQMAQGSRYADHDIKFLQLIHVWELYTLADLQAFVKEELPIRLQVLPDIRLVVIDSIAGIFRYETDDFIGRAKDMRELFHELKKLAALHNFAVVVTNHITSVPQVDGSSKNESACGQAFNNLVDVKLKVSKTEKFLQLEGAKLSRMRVMDVVYSPRLPAAKETFIIDLNGVSDCS